MWQYFNPNPIDARVGDCSVRAIAAALNIPWETAYSKLAMNGFLMGDMPSSDIVWGAVLRENGFTRHMIPDTCPDCYTVEDFAADHPQGVYVVKSDGHVATIKNGVLLDSWDSKSKVPFYFWTREEKQ